MEFLRYLIYDLGFILFVIFTTFSLFYIGTKIISNNKKIVFFNLSAIPAALLIFELFKLNTQEDILIKYTGSYLDNGITTCDKEFVGYGPKIDTSFKSTLIRKNNDSLIFEANYSFKNGFRTTQNNNDSSNFNISFLGGSHLFGEGLNDNQTVAYFLNKNSNSSYNITNYAFNGYGTHQALISLEKRLSTKKDIPKVIVYYFITEHIFRSAGNALWDTKGPLYEFENNELTYKGSFNENRLIKPNYLTKRLKIIWRNSQFYQSFIHGKYSEKDITRVKEIIKKMNALTINSGSKFILLIKEDSDKSVVEILNKKLFTPLKELNINLYYTNSIIKDLDKNAANYQIKGDGHPNEDHNKKIAFFLHYKISGK